MQKKNIPPPPAPDYRGALIRSNRAMMVVDPNNSNIEIIKVEIISRVQSHKAKIGGAHHWEASGNPDCSVPDCGRAATKYSGKCNIHHQKKVKSDYCVLCHSHSLPVYARNMCRKCYNTADKPEKLPPCIVEGCGRQKQMNNAKCKDCASGRRKWGKNPPLIVEGCVRQKHLNNDMCAACAKERRNL